MLVEKTTPNVTTSRRHALIAVVITSIQFTSFAVARTHLSRGMCDTDILMCSEFVKLSISCVVLGLCATPDAEDWLNSWMQVLPLAVCFAVMNSLGMWCSRHVNASLFAIVMQLKVLFTALCSELCLQRSLNCTHRIALALIMVGVLGTCIHDTSHSSSDVRTWAVAGLIIETFLSGVSNVYTQYLMQTSCLWRRNVQLATYSILLYAIVRHNDARCTSRFPIGTPVAILTSNDIVIISLGAIGGLAVAATLRFAGAIEKTIATSSSTVLTIVAEAIIVRQSPPLPTMCFMAVVTLAVILYSMTPKVDRSERDDVRHTRCSSVRVAGVHTPLLSPGTSTREKSETYSGRRDAA